MSIQPYFYWYQNTNNITIVPPVQNVNNTATSICLPASEQQVSNAYVLPVVSGIHEITPLNNYGNVQYSCLSASNYVYNPYIPEAINTQQEIIKDRFSRYKYHNNLVDLTDYNYLTSHSTTTYSTTRSIEYSSEALDYNYIKSIESHSKEIYSVPNNTGLEIVPQLPLVSTHAVHNNSVVEPVSTNLSVDDMSLSTSRTMNKYRYDDLRDIIEERHTSSRSESKIIPVKHEEDYTSPNDLKHILRRKRLERIERISNRLKHERESRHRELESRSSVKLKRRLDDIKEFPEYSNKLMRVYKRKCPKNGTETNPGLLERKTYSRAQKSSLSPDSLKRYLAYQRFLRNCYKSPSPQKVLKSNKISKYHNSLQLNEKEPRRLKREEKSKEKKIKTNKIEVTETIEKAKKKVISHIEQKERKKRSKLSRSEERNIKIHQSKEKPSKSDSKVEKQKIKIGKPKGKQDGPVKEKREKDQVNEKLARYLEMKKKRLELKERLFGYVERKKDKLKLETKPDNRLKQKSEICKASKSNNFSNKHDGDIDLRTVLTRKRTKNDSLKESKRIKTTKTQHKNVTVTVEQDVNKTAEPPKVKANKAEPPKVKTKKAKKIKLVINIVCANSTDTDDSEQSTAEPCTSPHQDLSFLDDFNVDEIVDSLNVPAGQTPTTKNSSKEHCHDKSVCANQAEVNLMESEVKYTLQVHGDSDTQQVKANTEPTTNASALVEDHQEEIFHNIENDSAQSSKTNSSENEQVINISDDTSLDATASETKAPLFYCDDVYEVIDITDDENNQVILLEDVINLDSNHQHEDEALITKSSTNFENKEDTNLQAFGKNNMNVEKDKINTSNEMGDKTKPDETSNKADNIIHARENIESKDICILNVEKTNTVAKEIALPGLIYSNDLTSAADIAIKDEEDVKDIITSHLTLPDMNNKNLNQEADVLITKIEDSHDIKMLDATGTQESNAKETTLTEIKESNGTKNTTDISISKIESCPPLEEKHINTSITDLKDTASPETKESNNHKSATDILIKNIGNNKDIEKQDKDLSTTNSVSNDTALIETKETNNYTGDIPMKNRDHKSKSANDSNTQKLKTSMKSNITEQKVSVLNANQETKPIKISEDQKALHNVHKENKKVPAINSVSEDIAKEKDSNTKLKNNTEQALDISHKDGGVQTKSDTIKSVDKLDTKQTMNIKEMKPSNKSNVENEKTKPTITNTQPNKIPKPLKPGQPLVNSKEKSGADNQQVDTEVKKSTEYVLVDYADKNSNKKPYVRGMEKRMTEYLKVKFNVTALIHKGYFSCVYKCKDPVGKTFALKVVKAKYRSNGIYKDKILTYLQKSTSKDDYIGIIRMIESFNSSGEWCFLSEYYPKTLKQALDEIGTNFHIDTVQILARQLVSAVTTLTNNQVIHTDIKPSHILLNSTHDKLKLCGFDRSGYTYNTRIIPSSGTASYRAPEVILGYKADCRIDVWATALVMYEMATGIQLFPGRFNNDILFKQFCTLGPLSYDMLEHCALRNVHFHGTKFKRQMSNEKWVFVQFSGTNTKLRHKLFSSYNRFWRSGRTQWQITKDLDKIEGLFKLLEQMLTMDPRLRLPITFVAANEFIYDDMFDT